MSVSNLSPASFRGVPFGVESAELSTGRRTAKHEFPGKDEPFIEDMGRKARSFTIEAFVVGDDYIQRRNALLEALERPGPGELVHPSMGKLTVQVGEGVTVKEAWNDGRVVRFTIPFLQTSKVVYPSSSANAKAGVASKKDEAWIATAVAAQRIRVERASSQAALTTSTTEALIKVKASARLAKNAAASFPEAVDGFTKAFAKLAIDIRQKITAPLDIVYGFQDCVARMSSVLDPVKAVGSYVRLYNDLKAYYETLTYQDTRAGAEQALNDAIMGQAIKSAVAGAACVAATEAEWDNRRQAEDARDILRAMLTEIMDGCTDDTLFAALADLRQRLGESVPAEGSQLRDLKSVTLQADLPAVVLAARIYGDIGLADDIVARNGIRHPGFVPAGKALEVIA